MPKKLNSNRHVGVLVETDDSWGRSVVDAVCRYARGAGWTLLLAPRDRQGRLRLPNVWSGHGVIASLRNRSLVAHVRRLRLPTVDVSMMLAKEHWFARVATDDSARAELAFDHLRSRGLVNFACYAPSIGRYSDSRAEAFRRLVEGAGLPCAMYAANDQDPSGWLTNYARAKQWIAKLPRPLGVFAADPYPARQLIEICGMESIRIPDEVAILSGDDDELLCNVASPQISSIELASQRIGATASQMLDAIMQGAKVPADATLVPPLRIRSRSSTDILAIDDPELAAILRFIRDRAKNGISVGDILKKFYMSRRSLEKKFRDKVDRSPAEEIRRTRFEYVCRVLLDTDLSIDSIAHETGFSSGASLSQAFKQHFGETPGHYRQSRKSSTC